jgi:RNA polymerase sigma factor (sigma-70 family)
MSKASPIEESATNRVTRLLARAKDGNTIARDELVDSVYHRLNGLCKGLKSKFPGVVIYEQTGDVMGLVWPKLLKELSTKEFKDSAHFFSFSATLIRNVLIDILRKYYGKNGRGAREVAVAPNQDDQTSEGMRSVVLEGSDTNSPDRDAMRAEVHSIIHRLPAQHQEMFNLRFYHGLRELECAEALNVDVRTVRRRWRSARLALASELGDQ